MSLADLGRIALDGLTYDVLKYLIVSVIITSALEVILRTVFEKLQERKQIIIFGACSICVLFLIFAVLGSKQQQPQFAGSVHMAVTGPLGAGDTVAVISMSILNVATMQSIVKNIGVEANINGINYPGMFVPFPKEFTFSLPASGKDAPVAITYHSEDDLLVKATSPIQGGAVLLGSLYVIFKNVNAEAFRAGGADLTVNFQDIMSRPYAATIKMTAKMGSPVVIPGLRTDMICRIPPEGLPK